MKKIDARPEIMIPLVGTARELQHLRSKVEATIAQVKKLYGQACKDEMQILASDPRYRFQWHSSEYGGVEQRWLLVHSEPGARVSHKRLESRVKKEAEKAAKQIAKHARKRFDCSNDARSSLESLSQQWKYHRLGEIQVEENDVVVV